MADPLSAEEANFIGVFDDLAVLPLDLLTIDGNVNGTGCSGKYGGKEHSSHCGREGQGESNLKNTNKVADEFAHVGNGSNPLDASLYVPRDDKFVEIDGNLIIQSILASDLAPVIPGIHPCLYRSPAMGQRIPALEERENVNSTTQEWYLKDFAGPLLSSGMCTKVFEFDASSSASDISME
uniref:Uncharacterized protein n=1 Tax=Solanum lycopersicum TaxID=4081 RepID=A0A3Q7G535_SOLLC